MLARIVTAIVLLSIPVIAHAQFMPAQNAPFGAPQTPYMQNGPFQPIMPPPMAPIQPMRIQVPHQQTCTVIGLGGGMATVRCF